MKKSNFFHDSSCPLTQTYVLDRNFCISCDDATPIAIALKNYSPEVLKTKVFSPVRKLMKDISAEENNSLLLERKQIQLSPKNTKSIKNLISSWNLSEIEFEIFLVVLNVFLSCFFNFLLSSDKELMKSHQDQISIQQEMLENEELQTKLQVQTLEELKKLNADHSSDISTSPTDNRKETKS